MSSATLEVQTADVAPLLTAIPGVADFLEVTELLGLPGLLQVLPATLLSPETTWDKVRKGLAGTGVAIIEVSAWVRGYVAEAEGGRVEMDEKREVGDEREEQRR